MILENTVSSEMDFDFSQYRQMLQDSTIRTDTFNANQKRQVQKQESGDQMRTLSHSESQPINIKPMWQRQEEQKQYIAEQMGREMYDKVMRILLYHKQNDSESAEI